MAPKKATTKKTAGASRQKKNAERQSPRRREIGAMICLFLGIVSFLGYFPIEGYFIDFFCDLVKGIIGQGFYFLPPALFVCSVILFFHRGRPVRLRVTSALCIPAILGSLMHLFTDKVEYEFSWGMFKILWNSGRALESGGVVSGLLSISAEAMVSVVGAFIILILTLFFLLFVMFNRSLTDIVDWVKRREKIEYTPEPEPDRGLPSKYRQNRGKRL